MAVINKELYDALIEAKVSDEKATKAASSDLDLKEDIADIKARLALVEKLQWVIVIGVIGLVIKSLVP